MVDRRYSRRRPETALTRTIAAIAIAAFMLAIAIWTVVPGPTMLALGFSLFASELALQCFVVALVIGLGAWRLACPNGRPIVGVLLVLTLGAFAWPVAAAPGTWSRAQAALR